MADINIMAGLMDGGFDDDEEDDACMGDDDGFERADEGNPLHRLEEYQESENIFNRQQAARSLLDTIRWAAENQEDVHVAFRCMTRLAEDAEATVRAELMEQVPHIAMYCQELAQIFRGCITTYLLPIVVRYLNDINSQVRKTSQAALLVLLEQDLLQSDDLDESVCPIILELASPDSIDDLRTEAVALMSKMAPLVGRDVTVRLFLPRFSALCTDAFFHVRKVCASNFGDMCTVVGQEHTENELISKFTFLCEDGVWGVRKACAECFMPVSYACSPETRRTKLSQLFLGLICDQSRWVRMAAFQNLGGFISTFADPSATGLYFSEEGVLVAGSPDEFPMSMYASIDSEGELERGGELPKQDEETDALLNSNIVDNCPLASQESMEIETSPEEAEGEIKLVCSENDKSLEEIRASDIQPSSDGNAQINGDVTDVNVESDSQPTSKSSEVAPDSSSKHVESDGILKEDKSIPIVSKGDITDENFKGSNDSGVDLNSPPPAEQENKEAAIPGPSLGSSDSEKLHKVLSSKADDNFSSFNYWRTPLPDIDIDVDIDLSKTKESVIQPCDHQEANIESTDTKVVGDSSGSVEEITVQLTLNLSSGEKKESLDTPSEPLIEQNEDGDIIKTHVLEGAEASSGDSATDKSGSSATCDNKDNRDYSVFDFKDDEEDDQGAAGLHTAALWQHSEEEVEHIGSTHVIGLGEYKKLLGKQDSTTSAEHFVDPVYKEQVGKEVIPPPLLEHYLSMTDPARAQTVDTEITKHCAFSLPAVAYTLGRRNWPCLKELYETLASDMQWKVRRTLAFSIHELAVIVGDQITHEDLVPIFNGFIKDLDEVRVGLLKHLAEFIKLLKADVRQEYLLKIPEFLNTDNSRNWRFREELAEQMIVMLDLYSSDEIGRHMVPIALVLAEDRVSEVRLATFRVVSGIVKKMSGSGDNMLVLQLVNDIIEKFAQSNKWTKRQMFAQICQCILAEDALSQESFAKDLLPSVIALSSDPVPNVRISLARTLAQNVVPTEYFTSYKNPHHEDLLSTVKRLQSDTDRDVRFFIAQPPQTHVADMVPV